jgi:hypothetical protein
MLVNLTEAMKHRGFISNKTVCSNSTFIVYSHTKGILAESNTMEGAQHCWELEMARCTERGKESDALVFQWLQGHWLLCGDLYELEHAGSGSQAKPLGHRY